MLIIENVKLKNYLFEIIELGLGGIIILFTSMISSLFFFEYSIYSLPISRWYDEFILRFNLFPFPDSARIDLTLLNISLLFLILDVITIIFLKKSIIEAIVGIKYTTQEKNFIFISKLIFYACFKFILVFLWIMSFKVNLFFLNYYLYFYFGYLAATLFVRIKNQGNTSLFFKLLNIKNQ